MMWTSRTLMSRMTDLNIPYHHRPASALSGQRWGEQGSTVVFKVVFCSHKNLVTSSITAILNVKTFTPDDLYIAYILN